MTKIFNLLVWHNWPESCRNQNAQPIYLSFRLFPINNWHCAKVVARVQSVLVLLVVPVVLAISFSPAWQTFTQNIPVSTFGLLKGLIILWGAGIVMLSLKLTPEFRSDWKHWISMLKRAVVFVLLYSLGMGSLIASHPWDWITTVAFAAVATGWFLYCGAQFLAMRMI